MSEKKRFLLRLDEKLFSSLEKWAADDLRSINGQIEYVLTEAVRRAGREPGPRSQSQAPPSSGDPEGPENRGG